MAHTVEDFYMLVEQRCAWGRRGGDEGVMQNDCSVDRRWANGLGAYARSGGDIA
jgi:hypothetical protein